MSLIDRPVLVIDFENTPELPRNFRTTKDSHGFEHGASVSWAGWGRLNASAASQFSELGLVTSLGHMPPLVYILDLREESHGFANGVPVSWYGLRNQANVGKSAEQIAEQEQALVSEMEARRTIGINKIVRKTSGRIEETLVREIEVERAETEGELVERMGLKYLRLPVTDHQHPGGATVDGFVEFMENLSGDAWVHFHCRSGKGRSSTFMVLYDIFHNAGAVGLEDIICRNAMVGSKDVSKISDLRAKLWKNEMARKRHEFVATFYSYMADPGGYGQISWTDWLAERGAANATDQAASP